MKGKNAVVNAIGTSKFRLTPEMLANWAKYALDTPLTPWQQEFIKGRVFGHWEYTPQDELQDRLNRGLKKKDLGEPVNTRFWRVS